MDEVVDEGSKPGTGTRASEDLDPLCLLVLYAVNNSSSHANKRCASFLGRGFCKNLLNNPSICLSLSLSQQIRV